MFRFDALFAGGVDSIILNYLPLFALAYGSSNAEIGVLGAAVGLGAAAACFPGAWLSARWRTRKPFILIVRGVFGNGLLLVFAVGPLLAGSAALPLIIVTAGVRSFVMFLPEAAWTSLATDLVPAGVRGRYFASRNLFFGIGGLAAAGALGAILTLLDAGPGWAAGWAMVFGLGVASALAYSRIPEHELPNSSRDAPAEGSARGVLQDTRFLRYAGTVVIWSLSVQAAVPFFGPYLARDLGASSATIAFLFVVGAATGLFGQAFIGRLHDVRGSRWMMGVAGVLICALPVSWYFVTAPYQVIAINGAGGLLWAAYLLASFNLLLTISPPGQQRYYVATYHTLVFLTMFFGPLLGGAIAEAWGIKALFLFSGAGRFVAVLAFIALVQDVDAERQSLRVRISPRAVRDGAAASLRQISRRVRLGAGL